MEAVDDVPPELFADVVAGVEVLLALLAEFGGGTPSWASALLMALKKLLPLPSLSLTGAVPPEPEFWLLTDWPENNCEYATC